MSFLAKYIVFSDRALQIEMKGIFVGVLHIDSLTRMKTFRVHDKRIFCSMLFADIVGFTAMSSVVTPTELVHILNDLFATFDRLGDVSCRLFAANSQEKRRIHTVV